MNDCKKQSRTPLLRAIQKAFHIAGQATLPNSAPANELADMYQQAYLKRRRFIGNILKTGVAIGAADILQACSKVADTIPASPPLNKPAARQANQPDIVIVGAGIAGLNCAYQLKKSGFTSTIYEGSSRTGGRIFTKTGILAPGLSTELGGEFIDSSHRDMLRLCQEFGLPLIDRDGPGEAGYTQDSFYISGRFYTEAEVINAFVPFAAQIKADINSLPEIMTYENHDSTTLHFDYMSIDDYLDSVGMHGFLRKGIETAYLTEYGLETHEQSSINFLYLFSPKTNHGFKIFGASDERYTVQGGNQSVTNELYNRVNSQVILEHRLVKIKEKTNGYLLFFENANGSTVPVHADMVVLAIPFTILRNVQMQVALPAWKSNAIQNLGYGTNSKLLLGFSSRVWRNYQYTGYVITNKSIQTGWDNSVGQSGNNGGYTIYQGGNKGVALGSGTPASQAGTFIDQLDQMWPGCSAAFNGNVERMHWPAYPFTKASYACYKVGQYTSIRGAEIKHVGQIYFAGEHCSSFFQGYMNGAAQTGDVAANKILKAIAAGQSIAAN